MLKNFIIIGDSYSTHKDYIPDGYSYYYSTEGRPLAMPISKMRPEETWWWKFADSADSHLVQNNSWSGTTIGYTGYSNSDCSKESSFITRYEKLLAEGFFVNNEIDTVLVFGGTNDSWANAPLGEEMLSGWERKDLFSVLPAISYFMESLKRNLPDKRIVFIGNCDIKTEITDFMKKAAEHFGIEYIALNGISKDCGHPTVAGMSEIYEQILCGLQKKQ